MKKQVLFIHGGGGEGTYEEDGILVASLQNALGATYEVRYPIKRTLPGGETDPAGMEIDLWVRSKEQNTNNFPPFETFVHLCWDEVTWK